MTRHTMSGDYESLATEAMGNWRKFDSFAWHRAHDIEDAENFTIVYGANRDSGLLDQSNADAIASILEPYTDGDNPDVISEHHDHWACGWVDGWAIRVRDASGAITAAFRAYCDALESLAGYPCLDESDYSRREYEAALENINDAAYRLKRSYELPDEWVEEVWRWLWDNDQRALDNNDDQGAYPTEEELRAAFVGLGYECTDDDEADIAFGVRCPHCGERGHVYEMPDKGEYCSGCGRFAEE